MSDLEEAIQHYLLNALQGDDPNERREATQRLWERWFNAGGVAPREVLLDAVRLMERGAWMRAEDLLTLLIKEHPDFAEAYNQRATVRYLMQHWHDSIEDCQQVIALNPVHFGALHGLGLCYMALEEYRLAIDALRRASEVQPHAHINRRLIAECLSRLE